jgi:hypothetical protein
MVRLVAGRTADLLAGDFRYRPKHVAGRYYAVSTGCEGEQSFMIFRHDEGQAGQGRTDPEGQHQGAHKHGDCLPSPVGD